jgi:hypothetical protein
VKPALDDCPKFGKASHLVARQHKRRAVNDCAMGRHRSLIVPF